MTNDFRGQRVVSALLLVLMAVSVRAEPPDMRVRKKLIATGWDHPDSQRLLRALGRDGEAAVRRRGDSK